MKPSPPLRISPRLSDFSSAAFRLFFFALLSASLLYAPSILSRAQVQDDDDDVVRVNSDLIVLNVTVTDAEGKYVHRLKQSDFKVFEDGREQAITNFGAEETPFAAAILLDVSGSMEGRISLARAAAIRFLDGLREDDVTAVYSFDTDVEQLSDFSPGRDLPPVVYGVKADGYTALNDAVMRAAIDLSKRPEKRHAIIVLSDGMDTRSKVSADKALATALVAANATIYTVDISDPESQKSTTQKQEALLGMGALKNFASKSGGRFVATPGGRKLSQAFEGIVAELHNQYTVGYRPSNRARDGKWREIEIKLPKPDINARTRRGYRAPKAERN